MIFAIKSPWNAIKLKILIIGYNESHNESDDNSSAIHDNEINVHAEDMKR